MGEFHTEHTNEDNRSHLPDKRERYAAYASRGDEKLRGYVEALRKKGLIG